MAEKLRFRQAGTIMICLGLTACSGAPAADPAAAPENAVPEETFAEQRFEFESYTEVLELFERLLVSRQLFHSSRC